MQAPRILILLTLGLLGGCATTDYAEQLATYRQVETARATADSERYRALAALAQGASEGTRQSAIQAWQAVAMNDGFKAASGMRSDLPAPPPTLFDRSLQVLQVLAPIATQIHGQHTAYRLGTRQSDNATAVALGDQRARIDSLVAVGQSMQNLGVAGFGAMQALGSSGFDALRGAGNGYAQALTSIANRPTTSITITGNDNAVATGGAATRTTTHSNHCTAQGGHGGHTGNAGAGGHGTASASNGTGIGGQGGSTGSAGNSGALQLNCSTGR